MKLFEKNTKGFKDAKTNRYVVLLILIFFGASLVSLLQHNQNKNFNTYQKINDVQVVDSANLSYNNKTQTYKYRDLSLNNLDRPISELNGLTYREVFNENNLESRNLAIPNLEDKEYLGDEVYRLYNANGKTLDYNVYNGVYTLNGTINAGENRSIPLGYISGWIKGNAYTSTINVISTNAISGDISFEGLHINTGNNYSPYWLTLLHNILSGGSRSITFSNQNNNSFNLRMFKVASQEPITFNNWKFTLQIEKGDTATDYLVPLIDGYNTPNVNNSSLSNEAIATLGLENVSKERLDYHFQIFDDLQQQENYEDLHFLLINNKADTTLTLDNLYNVGNNLNYDLIVNDTEVIPINSSHFNYYIQDNNTYNFKLRYRTKTQQSLDLINFNTYITEDNNINEFGYNNHQNNLSNSQKINMDFTDLKEMKSFGLDIWKDFNFKKVTNLITKPIQLIVSAYEWLIDFFTVSHNNYIPADEPGGLMYHASTNWFDRLKDFTLDVVQFWK